MSKTTIRRKFLILFTFACTLSSCSAFLSTITPTRWTALEKFTKQNDRKVLITSLALQAFNNEYSTTLPPMPSPLFVSLAQSQMKLLALSLTRIKSICLYLPQENSETGQLEFMPAIIYPHPDRLFIAGANSSSEAPALPKNLNRLPGFQNAASLLPDYPMISSNLPHVGKVEEVMCNSITKASTLSVPFLQGSQTSGVLLVWSKQTDILLWSTDEKEQISRAAESLSLALSMDIEKNILIKQTEDLQIKLSDALHQVKNPLQALRTYGKLLQQKLADTDIQEFNGGSPQLLELTKHLIAQSDRAIELLSPFDSIVLSLPPAKKPLALKAYDESVSTRQTALVPFKEKKDLAMYLRDEFPPQFPPQEEESNDKIECSNEIMEFSSSRINDEKNSRREEAAANIGQRITEDQSSNISDGEAFEMGFIPDVLRPLLQGNKIIARDKGIDLKLISSEDTLGVWFRPRALREAISNVLDNAMKYVVLGRTGHPKITVTINALLTPEQGVIVRIRDNGPGVPLKEQEAIFGRGYRGERTATVRGSGIGLDISRSIMIKMGGEVRLVNTSEEGSTFEVILYRDAR